jgi:hypothetical protein
MTASEPSASPARRQRLTAAVGLRLAAGVLAFAAGIAAVVIAVELVRSTLG